MKKLLLSLSVLLLANTAFAGCESCKPGDSNCPASCKSNTTTLTNQKPKGSTGSTQDLAPNNVQRYDRMDTQALPPSVEDAAQTLDGLPELDQKIPAKELEARQEAAYQLINSPDVNKFLEQLRAKKPEIIRKLQANNCLDKGYDTEISNFIDKLVNRKVDQKSLSYGIAQVFNENEISMLEQNIHNPPQDLQPRIGMVFIQFVMNEAPVLFTQTMKLSQKRDCLNKSNFE